MTRINFFQQLIQSIIRGTKGIFSQLIIQDHIVRSHKLVIILGV